MNFDNTNTVLHGRQTNPPRWTVGDFYRETLRYSKAGLGVGKAPFDSEEIARERTFYKSAETRMRAEKAEQHLRSLLPTQLSGAQRQALRVADEIEAIISDLEPVDSPRARKMRARFESVLVECRNYFILQASGPSKRQIQRSKEKAKLEARRNNVSAKSMSNLSASE